VLGVVLVVVLTIATASAGLLQLSAATARRQSAAMHRTLAFYLAEAGLAEAYAGLTIGKTGNVGSEGRPAVFGDGLFWVAATDNGDDTVTLDCTALVATGRAELSLVVERGESAVASVGFFSDGDLTVQPGTLVDGYDSEEGTYRNQKNPDPTLPPPPVVPARMGANATITVTGTEVAPTVVDGSVSPGPGLAVDVQGTVDITGPQDPARAVTPLPPVELPGLPPGAGIDHDGGVPLLIQPGETGFEFLTVRGGSELVLVGPSTLEVGRLRVDPAATIRFETTDGPVDLYVGEELVLDEGAAVVTSSLDTTQVTIQIAGTPAEPARLAAKGRYYGVVYAPEARVEILSGFKLFGAAVAQDLLLGAGVRLHFDLRLERASRETVLPKLLSWRIVELSTTPGMLGSDVFTHLGLDSAALPGPAAAHADQLLRVEYLDTGLVPRTYEGLESAFDWSQVTSTSYVTRDGEPVVEPKSVRKDIVTRSLEDELMASADLKRVLKTHSPLEDEQLIEAIRRSPSMDSPDLLEVLNTNLPLEDAVLLYATLDDTLSSTDLTNLLLSHSPLSPEVLEAARTRDVPLDAGDLSVVEASQ
jgi:hypothetical protein